ncbi:cAMP-independent regulatory protein pac2 [Mycena venus]|uniref:cAMP-independent regulatory protein pac2 n=1 Tax=Mycena venus TaxID=2733690 RepID=A0A8H6XBM3_9AGAR|nr:cAMP-independent regulatory protein pac2 [Mycena venus]
MQHATHPRLHVRNAHDAHVVFEATRQGFLRPITRRLDENERATLIQSGAVFVWEESDHAPGLKRWTDGRLWSQSRMREVCSSSAERTDIDKTNLRQPYLFYDEKLGDDSDSPDQTFQTYRFVDASGVSRGGPLSSAVSHQERSTNIHRGLVKQAYSAWVVVHPNSMPRKWHITAYFRYDDLPHIPTVDQDPCLRKIIVPAGLYRSGKTRNRSDGEDSSSVAAYSPPSPGSHRGSISSRTHTTIPSPPLPSMFSTVDYFSPAVHHRGARLSEDQRVIRILNGNFFGK